MKTIKWDDWGSSIELAQAVYEKKAVQISFSGKEADFLKIHFRSATLLTVHNVKLIADFATLAMVAGIFIYAISTDYTIRVKVKKLNVE